MTEEKINCEDIEQEQGGMEGVPLEQECGTKTSDHFSLTLIQHLLATPSV